MTVEELIYELKQAFHASSRDHTDACEFIEAKLRAAEELFQAVQMKAYLSDKKWNEGLITAWANYRRAGGSGE